jgi:hypothetical protein
MEHGTCTLSVEVLQLIHGFTISCRIDKKFFRPIEIQRWVVVIYADQRRFSANTAAEMVTGLLAGCRSVGQHQRIHSSVYSHR